MKYPSIIFILLLLPSLVFGANTATGNEQKLTTLLEQRYGDDIFKQIDAITTVESKIQGLHTDKILRLRNLLRDTKRSIILKNLTSYVTEKYIKSGVYKKEDFLSAYKELGQVDSKVDTHSYYADSLAHNIKNTPLFDENSREFRSLVYILFVLRDKRELDPDYETNLIKHWKNTWYDVEHNTEMKIPLSDKPMYQRILGAVALREHINTYSLSDLLGMRKTIEQERVSPNSLYFKAYIALRERLLGYGGTIKLPISFTHFLQAKRLSCEANSATDLINFYRTQSRLMPIDEGDVIDRLSVRLDGIVRTKSNLVWADPNEHFVGNMEGKQSSNIHRFTGYGIYAGGILPTINHFLSLQNLTAKRGTFDEKRILDSLSGGHPVMFWYLSAVSENEDGVATYWTRPINWKTPEGKDIQGFIGEHTGLIVAGEFDRSGHMTQVYYYQGRSSELEKKDFASLKQQAGYFDEVIYVGNR